jgi:hypothetical protein
MTLHELKQHEKVPQMSSVMLSLFGKHQRGRQRLRNCTVRARGKVVAVGTREARVEAGHAGVNEPDLAISLPQFNPASTPFAP